MNLARIKVLVTPYLSHIVNFSNSKGLYFGTILLIVCSTFLVSWNETSQCTQFIGLSYYCGTKEQSLLKVFDEFFSYYWIIIVLLYLLPQLLVYLMDSFSVSQILWIRLTLSSPSEVAISRVVWVISTALFFGVLGLSWSLITGFYHHISWEYLGKINLNVLGLVCHVLIAGSIVILTDLITILSGSNLSKNNSLKNFVPTMALILPWLLAVIFLLFRNSNLAKFIPYSVPFFQIFDTPEHNLFHFLVTIVISLLLLLLHIVSKNRYSVVGNLSLEKK
jgi:hypothetical protein